jgi:hypothetical protein
MDVTEEEFQVTMTEMSLRTIRTLHSWLSDQRDPMSDRSNSELAFASTTPA